MSRDAARILLLAIGGLGALAFVVWLATGRSRPQTEAEKVAARVVDGAPAAPATLYFPGPGARLGTEVRDLPAGDAEERARRVVEALLGGPEDPGLFAPLPTGVEVGSVFLAADGTFFLDLVAGEGAAGLDNLAWGSKQEMLAVYSLVNSVLANEPGARRVMLLWNGHQRPTFAGHIDVTRPLTLHQGLVARPAGSS